MSDRIFGDREKWDTKHAAARGRPALPCDPFFLQAVELVQPRPSARALDLASGTGRHALELARRGLLVEAWDVSPIGLEVLAERAAEEGLAVATRVVDLVREGLPTSPPVFDFVVVVSFLDRPIFGSLARLVAPGGHLVFATFTTDRPGDKPADRYCLAPGELGAGIAGLETLRCEEENGRAGLLARRSGDE